MNRIREHLLKLSSNGIKIILEEDPCRTGLPITLPIDTRGPGCVKLAE